MRRRRERRRRRQRRRRRGKKTDLKNKLTTTNKQTHAGNKHLVADMIPIVIIFACFVFPC